MADNPSAYASKGDLSATVAELRGQIEALRQAIPGMVSAGVQSACAKITLNGDAIISFSGQFPTWTATITLPALNLQGSGECVDGQIVLSITGGF